MRQLHVNMIVGLTVIGTLGLTLFGVTFLNITLGPSSNTLNMCKAFEREGYLADECFDEYGNKDRHCQRKPPEGE